MNAVDCSVSLNRVLTHFTATELVLLCRGDFHCFVIFLLHSLEALAFSITQLIVESVVQCPMLNVCNAIVNTSQTSYDTVVSVACNPGYFVNDNNSSVITKCLANASWSRDNIVCSRKYIYYFSILSKTTSKY